MSTTLNIRVQADGVFDGIARTFGGLASITVAGELVDDTVSIATSTTTTLLDTTGDDAHVDSFEWLGLELISGEADKVFVELEIDKGNEVGNELITLPLPFEGAKIVVPGYQGYANYTINFAGGTLDKIERVRIRNLSSTTSAKIRRFCVK